jgi:molybdenum cofactor cytidylyltransferase
MGSHRVQPVAATILAAGRGRRLGLQAKGALQIGSSTLLERLVAALRTAGAEPVSVVIGPYPETLLPLAVRCGARPLQHGRSDTTLIESQRLALQAHHLRHADHADRDTEHDLMLVLADLPWLSSAHVALLMQAWGERPEGIHAQMPVVDGVRGHPLILSGAAVRGVLTQAAHLGIRDWMTSHPDQVRPLPMLHAAYVTDIDTPEDLAAFRSAFDRG